MKSLLTKNNSFCLLIDVQEKLYPTIHEKEILLENISFLVNGLNILEIPILLTEQYPKGLGKTIHDLTSLLKVKGLEKNEFSAWLNPNIKQEIIKLDKQQVIIVGIESHVCVLQTALQMISHGFEVFIPEECVSSRTKVHKLQSIQRMQTAGAIITNAESCLFEMMETSSHTQFKKISQLIKDRT